MLKAKSSVRPGFNRRDYTMHFVPAKVFRKQQKKIVKMCMQAYDKVGIIRNVIDFMGDFASQGITLVHPNKTIERILS